MNDSGLLSGDPDSLRPADPGAVQPDQPVPGEDEIEVTPAELFIYANALAVKNGFSPITNPAPNKKDPNLVLPGDRLVLPDGRILEIRSGQYIYDIAGQQYRRDMARAAILDRQARGLLAVWKNDAQDLVKNAIGERYRDLERLAVTPRGKVLVEDLARTLREAGL